MHGRASKADLDSISKYDIDGCALYIAVSNIHLEHTLHGITIDEAMERMADAVSAAKDRGFSYIRATLEDASRVYLEQGERGLDLIRSAAEGGGTTASVDLDAQTLSNGGSEIQFEVERHIKLRLLARADNMAVTIGQYEGAITMYEANARLYSPKKSYRRRPERIRAEIRRLYAVSGVVRSRTVWGLTLSFPF
jgi:hypothetical protein